MNIETDRKQKLTSVLLGFLIIGAAFIIVLLPTYYEIGNKRNITIDTVGYFLFRIVLFIFWFNFFGFWYFFLLRFWIAGLPIAKTDDFSLATCCRNYTNPRRAARVDLSNAIKC